jgi:hypothetical protein
MNGGNPVDTELLYLTKRANFHRRMARHAACGEARSAHQAFVEAYLRRIEYRKGRLRPSEAERNAIADGPRPVAPIASKPKLVA